MRLHILTYCCRCDDIICTLENKRGNRYLRKILSVIRKKRRFRELAGNDPPEYYGGFEEEQLLGLLEMMEKNYIGWATVFAATVLNQPDRPEIKEELESRFCSTDPVIARPNPP